MLQQKLLYSSSNGDTWFLVEEFGRIFVRHEPNRASGGRASVIELCDFLLQQPRGPQHEALHRLIGTLLEDDEVPGG